MFEPSKSGRQEFGHRRPSPARRRRENTRPTPAARSTSRPAHRADRCVARTTAWTPRASPALRRAARTRRTAFGDRASCFSERRQTSSMKNVSARALVDDRSNRGRSAPGNARGRSTRSPPDRAASGGAPECLSCPLAARPGRWLTRRQWQLVTSRATDRTSLEASSAPCSPRAGKARTAREAAGRRDAVEDRHAKLLLEHARRANGWIVSGSREGKIDGATRTPRSRRGNGDGDDLLHGFRAGRREEVEELAQHVEKR